MSNAQHPSSLELYRSRWEWRGHIFGECMGHKNVDWIYVNIPKNATTWTKPILLDHQFENYNYHHDKLYHKSTMIVLRDPVERWLSGVGEFFRLMESDNPAVNLEDLNRKSFYEMLLDIVIFDDHTEQQVCFIADLDPKKSTYLWCDSSYRANFTKWMQSYNFPGDYADREYEYTTDSNPQKKLFQTYLKEFMTNEKYLNRIKSRYHRDYALINSVNFWGKN
jgi:hypothetical protein